MEMKVMLAFVSVFIIITIASKMEPTAEDLFKSPRPLNPYELVDFVCSKEFKGKSKSRWGVGHRPLCACVAQSYRGSGLPPDDVKMTSKLIKLMNNTKVRWVKGGRNTILKDRFARISGNCISVLKKSAKVAS